jgi:hypothetical protein
MGLQRTLAGWLALLTRTVAVGGLVFEIAVDRLSNPTALVVFGGLAGLPDVLGYRATVKQEVEREQDKKP